MVETVHTTERLAHLRRCMKQSNADIYVVPSEDSHQSEYIASSDARREFISGFSGSAGIAAVTLEKAALATDGRYFNQAAKQLDENWTLLKQGLPEVPTMMEWVAGEAEGGKVVGIDPTVITAPEARNWKEKIEKKGGSFKSISRNLVDEVWGEAKPPRPNKPVQKHEVEYAGKEFHDKLTDLRELLETRKSAGFVVSMLDEVAWLFNLRGQDIPYNPVFFAYAVVTPSNATLFVDDTKLGSDVTAHLGSSVDIRPYDAIFKELEVLRAEQAPKDSEGSAQRPFLVSTKASLALVECLGGPDAVQELRSPVAEAKAVKNDVERIGMRDCHVRDGAALIEYLAWLEDQLINKGTKLDEVDGADQLEKIRSKHKHFIGPSFDTISSTGPNCAIIHYKPERPGCAVIDPNAVYLCDSGGQYKDGTTDVTRTLHFGQPTEMERKAFTLVLKGNMALEKAVFPKGTTGYGLDVLARQFMWAEGLDYRHGTGHGVGSFLNVHEGPIGIGARLAFTEVPLAAGNVLSDEPGYYEDDKFGIRIENMMMVKTAETTHKFGENPWLGFEHVTLVPHCRNLLDVTLLTASEKAFLNDYHAEVWEKTKRFSEGDERTTAWLKRETAPI